MTGTNHALTGALIASAISNPIVFVPLAFGSHFVLDSLPHFGEDFGQRKRLSRAVWGIDAMLLLTGLGILIITSNWALLLGSFAAISPDLAWIYRFVFVEKWGSLPPKKANAFNSWHARIQKFETRNGIFVEIVWFCSAAYLCAQYAL